MPDSQLPLATPKTLDSSQHDAWGLRAAMLARGLATVNLPGNMVFSEGNAVKCIAFAGLSSDETTYAGMGQAKDLSRVWATLRFGGLDVPRHQHFHPGSRLRAEWFARRCGYPVLVSGMRGYLRRLAEDSRSLRGAFAEVGDKVEDHVLISKTVDGEMLRLLVHQGRVLAATGKSRRDRIEVGSLPSEVTDRAVHAVQLMPGLDLASVTLVDPGAVQRRAGQPVVLERISHRPHLRDFAWGSRAAALRLADQFLEISASNLGVPLPKREKQVTVAFDFVGVASPQTFTEGLSKVLASMKRAPAVEALPPREDGVGITIRGVHHDLSLIVSQALMGFSDGEAVDMVLTRPGGL